MLDISTEFSQAISDNSTLLVKAELYLSGSEDAVSLTGDDIVSVSIEQSTSSSGSFDVGAAVIGQLSLTLNNHDGRFDSYDFTGASIRIYVGKGLSSGTEWVDRGVFWVDQPDSYSGTISIKALDGLSLLEVSFSDAGVSFPCTVQALVEGLTSYCGLTLHSANVPHGSYKIASASISSNATCLSVLRNAMQLIGCYARVNRYSQLVIEWYDTSAFESEDWLNGGRFDSASPYGSGDGADGGNFLDYSSGDSADGGTFFNSRKYTLMHQFSSLSVNTDDVVITGIKVTAQNEVLESGSTGTAKTGESYTYGEEGYVLSISSNPLIAYGQAETVAKMIGPSIVGMRFRPFSGKAVCNPAAESGDPVLVIDRYNNMYPSYLTSVALAVNSGLTVSCSAKSASRNSADNAGAATSAIVAARNEIKQQLTYRDAAIETISEELANSSGLYTTSVKQDDGSYIYYLHNKPELSSSKIVYKITADAIGISTDGGETYATGLSANGDAVLNRIYAIGIDADHITTGALAVKNRTTGETVFNADIDGGTCFIGGDSVSIGGSTLTDTVSSLEATYGTCKTAAATAAKAVTLSNFTLKTGATIYVRFTYANTAASPTLNVNGTGAKSIRYSGYAWASKYNWKAYDTISFTYDGTYWELMDSSARRNARSIWANDTSTVSVAAGTVTFNSNTFACNATNFTVSSTGVVTANSFTANGSFTGGSLSSGYGMKLNTDGCLYGYRDGAEIGRLDPTAKVTYIPTGEVLYGMQLYGKEIIREVTPHMSTLNSSSTSDTSTHCTTGSGSFVYKITYDKTEGTTTWYYETLNFINGRLVSSLKSS